MQNIKKEKITHKVKFIAFFLVHQLCNFVYMCWMWNLLSIIAYIDLFLILLGTIHHFWKFMLLNKYFFLHNILSMYIEYFHFLTYSKFKKIRLRWILIFMMWMGKDWILQPFNVMFDSSLSRSKVLFTWKIKKLIYLAS